MIIAFVIAVFVLSVVPYTIVTNTRWRKRMAAHHGLSSEAFTAHFLSMGVDPKVAGMVYEVVTDQVAVKSFQPSPELSFENDFDLVGEDIDDFLEATLSMLQLREDDLCLLGEWQGGQIRTVQNLVLWADWAYKGLHDQHPSEQIEREANVR